MGKMVEDGDLDQDIFRLFIDKDLYLKYAQENLDDYQIDEIDLNKLPGYHKVHKTEKKKAA